ncbi:MAG: hypothetical protein IKL00_12320 [Oscillospiraceae bacterium]|nr:hypothetical protein [Oscillospiraceae bacterium]
MGKIVGATFPKPEQEKPVEIKVIVDGEPVASVEVGADETATETTEGKKSGSKKKAEEKAGE